MKLTTTAQLTILFWLGSPIDPLLTAQGHGALRQSSAATRPSTKTTPTHTFQNPNKALARALPSGSASRATPSGPYDGPPPISRMQILDIARSALGASYIYGGESWDPFETRFRGADCSGLIAKAWQVPHASESWEVLDDRHRPTTAHLGQPSPMWSRIPKNERAPGDIFVRFDRQARHAFIFEQDDPEFETNRSVWVYEAAQPIVRRKDYTLTQLEPYSLFRRTAIDDIGLVGRSSSWVFGAMIDTFLDAGGERQVGRPFDRSSGIFVYRVDVSGNRGYAQDFANGELGPATILQDDNRQAAHLVSGSILVAYLAHGGPGSALGFPTSPAIATEESCENSLRQHFVGGYIAADCAGTTRVHLKQ